MSVRELPQVLTEIRIRISPGKKERGSRARQEHGSLVRNDTELRDRRAQGSDAREVRVLPDRKVRSWLVAAARAGSSKVCDCSRTSRAGGTFRASPGKLTKQKLKIGL